MDKTARDALRALAGIKPAPKGAPGVLKSVFEDIPNPAVMQSPTVAPAMTAPSEHVTDLDKIEKLLNEALVLLNNFKKAK